MLLFLLFFELEKSFCELLWLVFCVFVNLVALPSSKHAYVNGGKSLVGVSFACGGAEMSFPLDACR